MTSPLPDDLLEQLRHYLMKVAWTPVDGPADSVRFKVYEDKIVALFTQYGRQERLDELTRHGAEPRCPNCHTAYDHIPWRPTIVDRIAELKALEAGEDKVDE